MGLAGDSSWSLDLIVRSRDPGTTLSVYGRGDAENSLELVGTLNDEAMPGVLQPVTIGLSHEDIARIGMSDPADDGIVFFADGEQIGTRIRAFSATPAIDGRYVIYAGVLDKVGGTVDFIAATDPIPLILLGGAVLVAGCAVLSGLERLVTRMEAQSSGFIDECRVRGGFPVVTAEVGLRFNPFKGDFGCNIRPKMECKGIDGNDMSSDVEPLPLDE